MDLQKIGVKLYTSGGPPPPLGDFVPVLHRWIQRGTVEGTLVDVVDYRHVHHGPGVMLIGFDFHVAIGDSDGERGISVEWKRPLEGTPLARIRRVLRVALDAAIALEAETLLGGAVTFDRGRLEVRAGDRALTPNDDVTWAWLRTVVESAVGGLMPRSRVRLERHPDLRRPLTVRLTADPGFEFGALRERLAANG